MAGRHVPEDYFEAALTQYIGRRLDELRGDYGDGFVTWLLYEPPLNVHSARDVHFEPELREIR